MSRARFFLDVDTDTFVDWELIKRNFPAEALIPQAVDLVGFAKEFPLASVEGSAIVFFVKGASQIGFAFNAEPVQYVSQEYGEAYRMFFIPMGTLSEEIRFFHLSMQTCFPNDRAWWVGPFVLSKEMVKAFRI